VVEDAACFSNLPGVREVRVVAHTDTAGSAPANLALSRRRAQVIADLLVAHGVDRGKIVQEAHGESRPAVPTGDGVSEPLNRRAVIQHLAAPEAGAPKCDGPTLPKLPMPAR
jgi:outer membrane protein OmpA-like peptidoglycan-associated protein